MFPCVCGSARYKLMTRCIGYCICPSQIHSSPSFICFWPKRLICSDHINELLCRPASCGLCPMMSLRGDQREGVWIWTLIFPFLLKFHLVAFSLGCHGIFYGCSFHSLSPFGFQDHFLPSPFSPRSEWWGTTHTLEFSQVLPTYLQIVSSKFSFNYSTVRVSSVSLWVTR